ncbi:MAG: glycosyltransferase [FCB group bacterium]|nr:glycosyltransferase [FCB group bacterium]
MRIALVSVAPPYRGGISLNTAILLTHLQKKHTVRCFNYSRLYPEFLFPGKTQYETGKPAVPVSSDRCLDSINPFTWYRTAGNIRKFDAEAVIFRFWNPFFAPALGTIAGILRKRSPDIKIMAMSDNIQPHEPHFFDGPLIRYFLNKMQTHVVLSEAVERDLHKFITAPEYRRLYHPIFDVFGKSQPKSEARRDLQIPGKYVILYFGLVRQYKGLDVLIRATRLLKEKFSDFQVLAVGECYGDRAKYEQLIVSEDVSDKFTWLNAYIPDQQVGQYFSAADVVALPYHHATQSGVVPLAYHFDKPVVVTRVGGLHEMVAEGESGFLVEPDSPRELADCLYANLISGKFSSMTEGVRRQKEKFSWEIFVQGIEELLAK